VRFRFCELRRAGLGIVLGLLWAASAGAQPFEVTNLNDSGAGSFRQAIIDANASASRDDIVFDPALTGTIQLLTDLDAVTDNLVISVDSAQLLTLQGPAAPGTLIDVAAGITEVKDLDLAGGGIKIQVGNTFTFTQDRDAEFDQDITDAGGLRKEGNASLRLSGNNSYGGNTVVAAGELIGDTDSLPGDIQNDASLVFDQTTNDTYGAIISGTGNVEKRGAGALTFPFANSYLGDTTVSEGTLIGDPTTIKGLVTVASGATLDVTTANQGSMTLSGAGNLIKRGGAPLLLTGNDTVASATVEEGTLSAAADAMPDNLTLNAATIAEFDQQTDGTQQGTITGDGGIEKVGGATLTLLGNNSYTGKTTVTAGTLVGNADSLPSSLNGILNNASLVFDQSTNGSYDGIIIGSGSFEKRGAGTLGISKGQLYTGTTKISAGELSLIGGATLHSAQAVTIETNGTLSGTGTVKGDMTVAGRVAPGTSFGTLSATKNVTFESGSVYSVEVEAPSSSDLLAVTGTLDIQPGSGLEITVDPGDFTQGVDVDFQIATTSSRQGNFDILTSLAFLDFLLTKSTATDVMLTVTRNSNTLATFAQTPNQKAVAAGLLAPPMGSAAFNSDFMAVENDLNTLTAAQVPAALDAMSGEQLAPFATQRLAIARRFHRAVDARMETLLWHAWESFTGEQKASAAEEVRYAVRPAPASAALAVGALAVAQAGAPRVSFEPATRESGLGGWLDAYGVLGSLDGDSNASTVDYQIGGGTIAMDYRFLDQYLVGIAGGYAHTDTDLKRLPRDGNANTGQVGLYLGQVTPRYYVDVAARFAYSSINTNREISFTQPSRTAKASFDGLSYGAHLAGGLNVADFAGIVFQPVAGFDYVRLYRESITEKGANSLNLFVPSENLNSIVTKLGARLFGQFQIADGLWFLPDLNVRWMHEFGDNQRAIDAKLAGAVSGGNWAVSSVSWPRDTAVIGVGWTITTRNHFQLYLDYDATVGSGVFENGFGGGARIVW